MTLVPYQLVEVSHERQVLQERRQVCCTPLIVENRRSGWWLGTTNRRKLEAPFREYI